MSKIRFLVMFGILFSGGHTFAQKVLPEFSLTNNKGKTIIRWLNNYSQSIRSISIQRSFDSINNFSSISSVFNPQSVKNGFIDMSPPNNNMFYRLFIVFDSGNYIFSESQNVEMESVPGIDNTLKGSEKITAYSRKNKKSKLTAEKNLPGRKSKNNKTLNNSFTKLDKKENPVLPPAKDIFIYPSKRVYTGKDNNIVINLPDIKLNKYVIRFFDEEDKFLFELPKITEDYLIIEKMNFLHSGWFKFEIYQNDKLLEKNKFNIPKEGKSQ